MNTRINKRDLPWVGVIAVSFAIGLAVSWQRWGNPLVDCGREMNQPLRLEQGEMLYSDVRHIYGPLSPYLNAALYRVFGPSLNVLYANGILTAAVILALTYWLGRKLMGPAATTAATLSVMWLCAFKQSGNYILPYSYSALHGCTLGLAALALLVKSIRLPSVSHADDEAYTSAPDRDGALTANSGYFVAAGIAAGLAMLSKTEMGLAAIITGVLAAALSGYPNMRKSASLLAKFVFPALAIIVSVYAIIALRVGWSTLSRDSFLFLRSLPPELVYFNKRISGFDQPVQSLIQMSVAAIRLILLAMVAAATGLLIGGGRGTEEGNALPIMAEAGGRDSGAISAAQLWFLLVASLALFFLLPVAGAIGWDKGPYLAMPFILLALLIVTARQAKSEIDRWGTMSGHTLVVLIISFYALSSLARVVLRVRSGGAYSSYLLPASVVMFTYAWVHGFGDRFRERKVRRAVQVIGIGLILADVAATAPLLAIRFREKNTYPVSTARGTIIAVPDLGQAVEEAIQFINRETKPGDPVAVLPEGTSLNFFTGRRNPLREEITTPGFLDEAGQQRAINQLIESNTRLILVTNRPTPEFGASSIGNDYCVDLMNWVESKFEPIAVFGPDKTSNLQIGDKTFFIKAYMRK
ncbi:MAG TPA: hypothetical protein VKM94_01390 [Blastocatellia bacterium]|nr:hypothetical protein [Blastocatellia bacterium]